MQRARQNLHYCDICGKIISPSATRCLDCKNKTFKFGERVEVGIANENGKITEYKPGVITEIIPPRKLQSTRYDVRLEETGELLQEVNPACLKKI